VALQAATKRIDFEAMARMARGRQGGRKARTLRAMFFDHRVRSGRLHSYKRTFTGMTSTQTLDACAHVGSGCRRPPVDGGSNALDCSLENRAGHDCISRVGVDSLSTQYENFHVQ